MFGRTPLWHAAEYGHEGVVKVFLERGDVNTGSSDRYAQTPLSIPRAACDDVMGLVSTPSPSGHETSPNSDMTQTISVNTASAQERLEFGQISRQHCIIPHPTPEVVEVVPLSPSGPSSNQLEALPTVPVL
ncbi:hypothetical protein B9Z19DRAFT_1028565, partial [Tuber borchii]